MRWKTGVEILVELVDCFLTPNFLEVAKATEYLPGMMQNPQSSFREGCFVKCGWGLELGHFWNKQTNGSDSPKLVKILLGKFYI